MNDSKIIPITPEVSVDSTLISILSTYAFPDPFDYIQVMDKLTDEAFDEVYSPFRSIAKNEERISIRYYQKLWDFMMQKGRDDRV